MPRKMNNGIDNLAEKLEIILQAREISSHKELADLADLNPRTLDAWKNGKVTPHESTLNKFCSKLGINYHWLKLELKPFCVKIADTCTVELDYLMSIASKMIDDGGYSILSSVRSSQPIDWMEEGFDKFYKGYWVGIHYWERFPQNDVKGWAEGTDRDDDKNKFIFRHLFHFHSYDRKVNTIKFNFASARRDNRDWNYRGHMIIAMNKMYYILETTKKEEVEALFIVTNRPSQDFENISGLLLASTPTNERAGTMSKPAAARIILQKINDPCLLDKGDEYLHTLPGIYDENLFSEETRNLLNNSPDDKVGILFPDYNGKIAINEVFCRVDTPQ